MSVPQVTDGGMSSLRAYATHFAIAANVENPESEELIEEHQRFAVVETVSGEAANSPVEATRANGVGREIRPETSK
jgi:hypothetical protein